MAKVEIVMIGVKHYEVLLGVKSEFWEEWMAAWSFDPDIKADCTNVEITDSYLRMGEWLVRVGLDDHHEVRTAIGFRRVEVLPRVE